MKGVIIALLALLAYDVAWNGSAASRSIGVHIAAFGHSIGRWVYA